MSDLDPVIFLPCPDGFVALSTEEYAQGVRRAQEMKIAPPGAAQEVTGTSPGRLVDAHEMAEIMGFSTWSVQDLARRGEIPVVRVGKRLRFDPDLVLTTLKRPPDNVGNRGLQPVEGSRKKARVTRKSPGKTSDLSPRDVTLIEGR